MQLDKNNYGTHEGMEESLGIQRILCVYDYDLHVNANVKCRTE